MEKDGTICVLGSGFVLYASMSTSVQQWLCDARRSSRHQNISAVVQPQRLRFVLISSRALADRR